MSHPLRETDSSERVSPLGLLRHKRWSCNHYSLLYLLLTDSSFILRTAGEESADHSQPRRGKTPWEEMSHCLTAHSPPQAPLTHPLPHLPWTQAQLAFFWPVFPSLITLPNIFVLKLVFKRWQMFALASRVGDFWKILLSPLIFPHSLASGYC